MVIAEDAADALEEVLGVVVGMEPDEVSPEHPLQQRASPAVGHEAEQLIGREGDVQEEAHLQAGPAPPEHRRQQQEVVVVDPDDVVRSGLLQDGVAEHFVDELVGRPGALVERDERGEVVEQRPERLVAVTLVEALGVLSREEHGPGREVLAAAARHLGLLFRRDGPAGPADPGVTRPHRRPGGLQVGPQARGQAAGALGELQAAFFLGEGHGEAVRDDDELHGGSRGPGIAS